MEAVCLGPFMRAAAAMAAFELRVRIVADLAPEGSELQRAAISEDLPPLIERLCARHDAVADDMKFLKAVASIRNKLLHPELSKAVGRSVHWRTSSATAVCGWAIWKTAPWAASLDGCWKAGTAARSMRSLRLRERQSRS
jgi:hypothetical protein